MLLRLLLVMFALNAIAPPAMASVVCDMMNDADMSSMTHSMSSNMANLEKHDMSEVTMECSMEQDHSCNSTECLTSCATSFSLITVDNKKNVTVKILDKHPKDNLLSLYDTFIPLNTPPPLV